MDFTKLSSLTGEEWQQLLTEFPSLQPVGTTPSPTPPMGGFGGQSKPPSSSAAYALPSDWEKASGSEVERSGRQQASAAGSRRVRAATMARRDTNSPSKRMAGGDGTNGAEEVKDDEATAKRPRNA
jgi:hypothetical protein